MGSSAAPLTLREVIDTVERTHPKLEAARQGVEVADAKTLAARGGFDPMVLLRGKWTPVGYYPQGQVDASVRQATPLWGAELFAGYRLGWGSYPIYKGDQETLSRGELRAGIKVPLWNGGPIDSRRAKLAKAKLGQRGAGQRRDATQLEIERQAAVAYWDWVAAGHQMNIAKDLLGIAEDRNRQLNELVAAGSLERIKLVDNRRLVLERSSKLISAQRKFREATLKLSLYTRDNDNKPIQMELGRLPEFPEPLGVDAAIELEIDNALATRPDILALQAEQRAKAVEVRLARNKRAPKIDVQTFVSRDLGDGPAELRPTEWGAGMVVAIPLPMREARGEYRAAKAKLAAVEAKLRGLRDKVAAEIRMSHVALTASSETVGLAREQVQVATELADAARTQLTEGASDLIVVNLRELSVAKAATEAVNALADYHRAYANFRVSAGLSPAP